MNIWGRILRMFGWEVDITAPRRDKCVICVAPHTSNFDFLLGLFAYKSLGRNANFLMKKFWFFFPLKYLLRALGGIPVPRKSSKGNLTNEIIRLFERQNYINLAITPEGTRSARMEWRTGFLRIALGAHVPIQFGVIDYKEKRILIKDEFYPSNNITADMVKVKEYYSKYTEAARYPDKFKL